MHALQDPVEAARWLRARVHGRLQTDSRKVGHGDGFIAWPGAARDGRAFVAQTLAQGAQACLVEREGVDNLGLDDERVATYAGLKAASGPIAAVYYEDPSRTLDVLAVTGTNGKTSSTWWLAQALSQLRPEHPCGLIGTLGVGRVPASGQSLGDSVQHTGLTTPDPVLLQETMRRFADEGLSACAIEASSIGIAERRLDGTTVHTAIFTNFTQDHLDYHVTMAAYWEAKAELFRWPGLRAAVVNVDDPKGVELAAALAQGPVALWTVSLRPQSGARVHARTMHMGARGVALEVSIDQQAHRLDTAILGDYNVSNLLEVIAALCSLGYSAGQAVGACRDLRPVPGRMEFQGGDGTPLAVVDYAHTPDALSQVLKALQPLARQRGGRVWCVFGCGGDRDPLKRPLMGAAAAALADHLILTNDNPRSESPHAIVKHIFSGCAGHPSLRIELDRARAVDMALTQAAAQDLVLVAGKGHEDYQEVAGVRQPYSDAAQVQLSLARRAPAHKEQA